MVANILHADPPQLTLGVGSKDQNSTFSEHGHVAYQIKENHECNNMVANILPTEPAREKYWYEIHDVLVPIFFMRCEELVPTLQSVKFTKCKVYV